VNSIDQDRSAIAEIWGTFRALRGPRPLLIAAYRLVCGGSVRAVAVWPALVVMPAATCLWGRRSVHSPDQPTLVTGEVELSSEPGRQLDYRWSASIGIAPCTGRPMAVPRSPSP
jgi:hypothetical protein